MMIFKKAIPRRTFLRGFGATLALPLLDGMVPAFGATGNTAAKPTVRMTFIYGPNGRIMNKWTPTKEGAAFELTPTLEPLAPFRDRLLVLSGLNIKAADPIGNEPGGVHARPCAAFLTGIHPKPGGAMGISADQLAARELGKYTQLGSIELAMDSADVVGAADGAYSDAYTKTISWRSPTTPLPMENNPRKVFERLLGESGSTDPAERLRRIQNNYSILDFVTQDVASLLRDVGPSDRAKLTEYLDATRDIERRIQLAEQQASRELPEMERPAGVPSTYSEHAKLMFDLQVLAYQGDLTRVVTYMLGRESGTGPTARSASATGITRCRTIRVTPRRSSCARRSTRFIPRCSRISWRRCNPLRTATAPCWTIRSLSTAAPSATATRICTTTCPYCCWAVERAGSREAVTSGIRVTPCRICS